MSIGEVSELFYKDILLPNYILINSFLAFLKMHSLEQGGGNF